MCEMLLDLTSCSRRDPRPVVYRILTSGMVDERSDVQHFPSIDGILNNVLQGTRSRGVALASARDITNIRKIWSHLILPEKLA